MKKRWFVVSVLAVLWGWGISHADDRSILPLLVKKIHPAVVTVVTYDMNRNVRGLGSGFFIDDQGHLLTNHHVLKGAFSAEVKTGENLTFPVRFVVAENEAADLVKVRVDIPATVYRWVEVIGEPPEIAEPVIVVGSPLGLEQTVSSGIVSAMRELPGVGRFFQISAPISRGSSGSPVVDMAGRVIGIVSFMAAAGQNLNFAISGESAINLEPMPSEKTVVEWAYGQALRTPSMAEDLCRRGFQLSVNGEFDKALEFYREATEKDPKDAQAWYGLGSCYIGLGDAQNAVATYQRAIVQNPDDPRIHYHLGKYYTKEKRWSEAIAAYEDSLRIDPDDAEVYHWLGIVQARLGLLDSAIRSHEQAVRLKPDDPRTHYTLGVTLTEAGKLQDALTAYGRAVALRPDYLQAHNNMGVLFSKMDRAKEAVVAHQQVVRIQPDYVSAHLNLGVAYLIMGDKAMALEEYKILKRMEPEAAAALFNLIYEPPE